MRVFVTGATGFIGSEVVRELISEGYEVLGLARSDEAAESLAAAGATVHRGSLEDLDSLRRGAAMSDGVIHTAFMPIAAVSSNPAVACETDLRVIETLGTELENSDRPLVITSAIAVLKQGHIGTEENMGDSTALGALRIPSEKMALSFASRGVRTSIVRLPPSVHGDDNHGFVPTLINIARTKGISAYISDSSNRWSAVHRQDAARLFRLALEKAPAGARLHGVAEEGVLFRDIAVAIGQRLNLPVAALSNKEASKHFSWFAPFAAIDSPASSTLTRDLLGWRPMQPPLIQEIVGD
ncbi:SDR family oxidoreductase [Clostridium sp.]|uniref:SDR family oxidoreductase n=1 Tax=Clostridium sp. TaxID=1506 RepID=UPI0026120FC0|nr:SDR family oxidoreductase [Clostridium sp.]